MSQQQAWNAYNSCVDDGGVPEHCEAHVQTMYPNFSASGGGQGTVGQYFGNPGNWIDFGQGLTGIVGNIVGLANGQPIPPQGAYYGPVPQERGIPSWVLWTGVAVVALIILILLVIAFKK